MNSINDFIIENDTLMLYTGNDTDVVIPEGVTVIYYRAFGSLNKSIETLHLPASVKKLDADNRNYDNPFHLSVFKYLHALSKITVSTDSKYFKVCDGVLYSKNGKTLWHVPTMSGITEFTVPETVQYVKYSAFPSSVGFVYFPGTKPDRISSAHINCPFFAPNMNLDKMDPSGKHLAVKGMAVAEYKGFDINKDLRIHYLSYIRSQRRALIEYGATPELIMLMAKENILPQEMYDDCIEFFRKNNYIETVAVLLECKAKYCKPMKKAKSDLLSD